MTTRDFQLEYLEILNDTISPILKELSFKKRGINFYRKINDIIQLFSIQKSQWNDKENISFTFHVGFFNETIYKVAWDKKMVPKTIKEYDCFLSTKIGQLSQRKDYWYELNENCPLDQLKQELKNELLLYVEPIFELYNSLEAIAEQCSVEATNEPLKYIGKPYDRIVFLMESNRTHAGIELIKESYKNALIPKPDLNQHYLNQLKRLAMYYSIEL